MRTFFPFGFRLVSPCTTLTTLSSEDESSKGEEDLTTTFDAIFRLVLPPSHSSTSPVNFTTTTFPFVLRPLSSCTLILASLSSQDESPKRERDLRAFFPFGFRLVLPRTTVTTLSSEDKSSKGEGDLTTTFDTIFRLVVSQLPTSHTSTPSFSEDNETKQPLVMHLSLHLLVEEFSSEDESKDDKDLTTTTFLFNFHSFSSTALLTLSSEEERT